MCGVLHLIQIIIYDDNQLREWNGFDSKNESRICRKPKTLLSFDKLSNKISWEEMGITFTITKKEFLLIMIFLGLWKNKPGITC